MAMMDDKAFQKEVAEAKQKMAKRMARLTLWKLRDMRRTWTRPRRLRLPAQARALRSVVREAQMAGLVPVTPEGRKNKERPEAREKTRRQRRHRPLSSRKP